MNGRRALAAEAEQFASEAKAAAILGPLNEERHHELKFENRIYKFES
jgi:hypothetical protein